MSNDDHYKVVSYQSGTTWIDSDDIHLHIGYYSMKRGEIQDAKLMGRGLMEKCRLARALCECLNKARLYNSGKETVLPYIWGLTTCTAEIGDNSVEFFDEFFGVCPCENMDSAWKHVALPASFVEDLILVLDRIEINQHDD